MYLTLHKHLNSTLDSSLRNAFRGIFLLIFLSILTLQAFSADYKWVGGNNNNDWATAANWVCTNCGSPVNAVPTIQDNVLFDASGDYSMPVMINSVADCNNMVWLPGLSGSPELKSPSSSCVLNIAGSMTLDAGMLLNLHFRGVTNFKYGGVAPRTITMAGNTFPGIVIFDELAGDWTLQDAFNATYIVRVWRGAVHFSNTVAPTQNQVSIYVLQSNITAVRTMDLSNTNLEITGYGDPLELRNEANLTFISTNSIVRCVNTAQPVTLHTTNLTFDEFSIEADVHATYTGENTFNELRVAGKLHLADAVTTDNLKLDPGSKLVLQPGHQFDVDNIDAIGDCQNPIMIQSLWSGTSANIKWNGGSSLSLQDVFLEDVDLLTPPGSITGTYDNMTNSVGWGTSSIAGEDFYWVNDGGNWNDPGHWVIAQQGFANPNACLPGPADNVNFDGNSFNGGGPYVVSVNVPNAYCRDMIWSGVNNTPDFEASDWKNSVNIYGGLELAPIATMGFSFDGDLRFRAHTPSHTVNTSDHALQANVYFNGSSGEWRLDSDLNTTETIYVDGGRFKTEGYNLDAFRFASKPRNTRTIDLGVFGGASSIINVDRWDMNSARDEFGPSHYNTPDPYLTFEARESEIFVNVQHAYCGVELEYNDITLNNPISYQNFYARRCTVKRLNCVGDATLSSFSNGLDELYVNESLQFNPGNEYTISGRVIFGSSADFIANGSCTEYIDFSGGEMEKNAGLPISVSNCIITNNEAISSGGVQFNTSSSILNNAPGWNLSSIVGSEFHFQAGTDQLWSNPNNWYNGYNYGTNQFTSPSSCIPGPFDDVYFHFNSFDNQPNVEILVNNAYCLNMTWLPGSYPAIVPQALSQPVGAYNNSQELNVFGSMTLLSNADMDWVYEGQIRFRSHTGTCDPLNPQTLTTDGQTLHNQLYVEINQGCTLQLQDDLDFAGASTVEIVRVHGGWFDLNEFDIHGFGLTSLATTTTRGMDMENSSITTRSTFHLASTNFTLNSTGSTVYIGAVGIANGVFASDNLNYNNVEFLSNNCQLNNSGNSIENATFHNNGVFNGSNSFEVLTLTAGSSYDFKTATTQTITNNSGNGTLNAIGSNGQLIVMESSNQGVQAHIESEVPLCLDYVQMRDLTGDLIGSNQSLVAGANSINVANNSGWSFFECEPILIESCVDEEIIFDQFPNGEPTWDFGDGTIVTQPAPVHAYTQAGTYYIVVTFQVFDINTGLYSQDSRNLVALVSQSCCDLEDFPDHVQVQGDITSDVVWGDQVFVLDNIFVKQGAKLDITNADVVFSDGTGIYVEDSSRLVVTNSTLRPCDESASWAGIDFDDSSDGRLIENIFIQPVYGVELNTTGTVDVTDNQFSNFYTGVYVHNSNSAMLEHMISGNDFTLNRYVDDLSYPTTEFYGVYLDGAWISPSVSQNTFHFTYVNDGTKEGYGIYNSGGAVTASENTFTNVFYPYFQIENTNVCAIENNEIIYNAAFGTAAGISNNDVVGITIEASHVLTNVWLNRIYNTSTYTDATMGIYVSFSPDVRIAQNEVNAMDYGILSLESSPTILKNTIDYCSIGISATKSDDYLAIRDNMINQSFQAGIWLDDCFGIVQVNDNVVDHATGSNTFGIVYTINDNHTTEEVEIVGNCVLDCSTAVALISLMECHEIPIVRNNYLYNYSQYGIEIELFNGFIGSGGSDPGKNSFVANIAGAIDFQNNTPSCFVDLNENWPENLNTYAGIWNQPNPMNSTAACGRQTPDFKLQLSSGTLAYLEKEYKVESVAGNINATPETYELLASKEGKALFQTATSVLQLLLSNDDRSVVTEYMARLNQTSLSQGELAWLNYQIAFREGNLETASQQLSQVQVSSISNNRIALEQLRLSVYGTGRSFSELNEQEQGELIALYESDRDVYTRNFVHQSLGDYPYEYKLPEFNYSSQSSNGQVSNDVAEVSVYPNPASDAVTIALNVNRLDASTVEVMDMFGKVLDVHAFPASSQIQTIDVSQLASGVYHLNIVDGERSWKLPMQVVR